MGGILNYIQEIKGKIEKLKLNSNEQDKCETIEKKMNIIINSKYYRYLIINKPSDLMAVLYQLIDFPYFLNPSPNIEDFNNEEELLTLVKNVKVPLLNENELEENNPYKELYESYIDELEFMCEEVKVNPLEDTRDKLDDLEKRLFKQTNSLNNKQIDKIYNKISEVRYYLVKEAIAANALQELFPDWSNIERDIMPFVYKEVRDILSTDNKEIKRKANAITRIRGVSDVHSLICMIISIERDTNKRTDDMELITLNDNTLLGQLELIEKQIGKVDFEQLVQKYKVLVKEIYNKTNKFIFLKDKMMKDKIDYLNYLFLKESMRLGSDFNSAYKKFKVNKDLIYSYMGGDLINIEIETGKYALGNHEVGRKMLSISFSIGYQKNTRKNEKKFSEDELTGLIKLSDETRTAITYVKLYLDDLLEQVLKIEKKIGTEKAIKLFNKMRDIRTKIIESFDKKSLNNKYVKTSNRILYDLYKTLSTKEIEDLELTLEEKQMLKTYPIESLFKKINIDEKNKDKQYVIV